MILTAPVIERGASSDFDSSRESGTVQGQAANPEFRIPVAFKEDFRLA